MSGTQSHTDVYAKDCYRKEDDVQGELDSKQVRGINRLLKGMIVRPLARYKKQMPKRFHFDLGVIIRVNRFCVVDIKTYTDEVSQGIKKLHICWLKKFELERRK